MSVRRTVIFGAPLLAYVAAMLHPQDVSFTDDPRLSLGVHLAIAPIVCLLAWMTVLLVDGIDSVAARIARVLAVPFAVAYTVYTTFGGTTIDAFVWEAQKLPADEQLGAAALIHNVSHGPLERPLYVVASLLWLGAMLAVVAALRGRAPVPALALLAAGAAAFAWSHVPPWGPAGMAAVLAGAVWVELRRTAPARSREDRRQPRLS